MKTTRPKHIRYREGQWFAVPLRDGGYAIGIIARGAYKTRGGLGYFFGPRHDAPPDEEAVQRLEPADAILIKRFGDLGIIEGRWPLIASSRTFRREDWPLPKFARLDAVNSTRGWLVEYDYDIEGGGEGRILRQSRRTAEELEGSPRDGFSGAGAIEITLSKLLSKK